MKLFSWNVNGLRACLNKGFMDFFKSTDADIFCIQESKMQPGQAEIELPGYTQYWNSTIKKGYSGTAVFAKAKPDAVTYDTPVELHSGEGRVITLEYKDFFLVNCYAPNAQHELARLDYRMRWEDDFLDYLMFLDGRKPVILCGDLNVAHQEIDLKNPKSNMRNAGFTREEREKMTRLLKAGFVDSFRYLYPEREGAYTWWSYMFHAREKNAGWRIDYFIVSDRIKNKITDCVIHPGVMGSDHCPVELDIAL